MADTKKVSYISSTEMKSIKQIDVVIYFKRI